MIQTLIEETKPQSSRKDTEEYFFGKQAPSVNVTTWRSDVQTDSRSSSSRRVLTTDEESFLFRKYTYVKSRLDHSQRGKSNSLKWNNRLRQVTSDLVNANMSLVLRMAKRCNIPNVDFPEMVSEGSMALLRAIDKFDVTRGYKFSTYACQVILRGFNRMATNAGKYHSRYTVGLNPELEKGENDAEIDDVKTSAATNELKEILENNSAGLSNIEMGVLKERFGLSSGKPKTLAQTGKMVGRSIESVRQLQLSALEKLRELF